MVKTGILGENFLFICEVSISMIVGSKNLNKICLNENYSKSTKIAIKACKFSKFSRGSMPPDPPRAFLVSLSASNLFCRKKNTFEKNVEIMPPFKIFRYATAMVH